MDPPRVRVLDAGYRMPCRPDHVTQAETGGVSVGVGHRWLPSTTSIPRRCSQQRPQYPPSRAKFADIWHTLSAGFIDNSFGRFPPDFHCLSWFSVPHHQQKFLSKSTFSPQSYPLIGLRRVDISFWTYLEKFLHQSPPQSASHAWAPVCVLGSPDSQGEGGAVWYSLSRGDCVFITSSCL